jgi:hypothetical protein
MYKLRMHITGMLKRLILCDMVLHSTSYHWIFLLMTNAWSKLKHPHILELLGLAQHHECLAMISPWMEYGSIMAVIRQWPHLDRYQAVSAVFGALTFLG